MKRKIIATLLASTMLLSVACSKDSKETEKAKRTREETETTEEVDETESESEPTEIITTIEVDAFDKEELYGYDWNYTEDDGFGARFRFNEDGTGEYTSGGGESENAYFTSITWELEGDKLSVTRRDDITDTYTASLNGNTLTLIDANGNVTDYIRTDRPQIEETEVTIQESRETEPSTTESNEYSFESFDVSSLRNENAVELYNSLVRDNWITFDCSYMMEEESDDTFPSDTVGFMATNSTFETVYCYLEFPEDYEFSDEQLAKIENGDQYTTIERNGNTITAHDDASGMYGYLDLDTNCYFFGQLANTSEVSAFAQAARDLGFNV